ncbi:MAG: DUF1501 domain-containing protein [Gemmataceae bacterium]
MTFFQTPSRRELLQTTSAGFGALALAALAGTARGTPPFNAVNPLAPKPTHLPARAKRVIFLAMEGGPSHLDTFDHKPKLTADSGKTFEKGRLARGAKLMGSPYKFTQQGQSGLWISELFPEVAKHADKLCLLRGMQTDIPNHPQATLQMHCGLFQFPRPSLGAWVLYGLGSTNENLPGFVTINPPTSNGGAANYGNSFLPALFQGTKISGGNGGTPTVSNIKNPKIPRTEQRTQLDFLQSLNRGAGDANGGSPVVEGLIESYELAFRMQADLPAVLDISKESRETLKQYGISETGMQRPGLYGNGGGGLGGRRSNSTDSFGRQCLMARKLVEAGVRFVEVGKGGWDQHRNLKDDLSNNCASIDQPIAALLADLESRGLLKDTLVMWGGEFGRTPYSQGTDGRDHNNKGYTMWMAGGGVRGGLSYGATDEYGYEAIEGKTHIHDWHATILHLLGLDHEKLTFRHAGRDMRLTDVKGNVVKGILA